MHVSNFSDVQAKDWTLQVRLLFVMKLGQSPSAPPSWIVSSTSLERCVVRISSVFDVPETMHGANFSDVQAKDWMLQVRLLFKKKLAQSPLAPPSCIGSSTSLEHYDVYISSVLNVPETMHATNFSEVQAKDWMLQVGLLSM